MSVPANLFSILPVAGPVPENGRFIVTPERAKEWLDKYNDGNRPVRKAQIASLVEVLQRGEWCYNGQPLVFSDKPRILSAQHRLMACFRSGVCIDTDIKVGVPDESYRTIDVGRAKTNADFFSADGEANTYLLAAVVAWVWRWESNTLQNPEVPSPVQSRDVLNRHPGIRTSVATANRASLKRLAGGSVSTFVHYVAGRTRPDLRDSFFESLLTGENLQKGSPALLLRERLQTNQLAKAKLPPIQVLALFIKAWNAFRNGRSIAALRWRQDGDVPEAFPQFDET